MRSKLKKSFDEFSNETELLKNNGEEICSIIVNDVNELSSFKSKIDSWSNEAIKFIKESFIPENSELVGEIENALDDSNPTFYANVTEQANNCKLKINRGIEYLIYNRDLIGIQDVISKPHQTDLNIRKGYTITEKMDLILEKLFEVYGNHFYQLDYILEGNGIVSKRHDEHIEMGKILEQKKLIERMVGIGSGYSYRLTTQGVLFIEEKRKTIREDFTNINHTEEQLNSKFEEIKELLKTQGDGQQIIYDEISELKELYTKVPKKNWAEMVKGKLLDLGYAQIINEDTVKHIYKELTEHVLHLPSGL